jgi:hypothetical protein
MNYSIETDPRKISTGLNNHFINRLNFTFGSEYSESYLKKSFLRLTPVNHTTTVWDIPEDLVQKMSINRKMRLDESMFQVNYDPFWFKFGDPNT